MVSRITLPVLQCIAGCMMVSFTDKGYTGRGQNLGENVIISSYLILGDFETSK